jgi:hypothetical protein
MPFKSSPSKVATVAVADPTPPPTSKSPRREDKATMVTKALENFMVAVVDCLFVCWPKRVRQSPPVIQTYVLVGKEACTDSSIQINRMYVESIPLTSAIQVNLSIFDFLMFFVTLCVVVKRRRLTLKSKVKGCSITTYRISQQKVNPEVYNSLLIISLLEEMHTTASLSISLGQWL